MATPPARCLSNRKARIARPIVYIIAVVAVLEIQADMNAVTAPKANRMRLGRWPIQRTDSTPNASRRSSPCRKMARARMNDPMNRNIKGSANGAKTSLAGATRNRTQAQAAISAVTGNARASVTHSTTTAPITAASRCASGCSVGIGQASRTANTTGASSNPPRRRPRSNICSPALSGSMSSVVGSMPCSHAATFRGGRSCRPDYGTGRRGKELVSRPLKRELDGETQIVSDQYCGRLSRNPVAEETRFAARNRL